MGRNFASGRYCKSNCVSNFHNKQFQLQGNVQVSKVLYQTVKYVYFQYHIWNQHHRKPIPNLDLRMIWPKAEDNKRFDNPVAVALCDLFKGLISSRFPDLIKRLWHGWFIKIRQLVGVILIKLFSTLLLWRGRNWHRRAVFIHVPRFIPTKMHVM